MVNVIEIVVRTTNDTSAGFEDARAKARGHGEQVGDEFTQGIGDKVRADLPAKVDQPLTDAGRKAGQDAGNAAAGGISPLIIGAFGAAASIGPAALLAGTAGALVGVAALVGKSNQTIAADYANLGQTVTTTLGTAITPIVGDLDSGIKILDNGVASLAPQLTSLFAAVGPDAAQLAGGLVSLAQGALPGITSAMRAVQPIMHDVAGDFGKIGQGVGGLFAGLGSGVGGAATGLNALSASLAQLLPDIGKITGDLANGLGPALSDILTVAAPVANAFTALVGAIPPQVIQGAAVAVGALFAAFKVGSIAGVVQDGAAFTGFLKGTPVAASEAEGAVKSLALRGIGGLSTALDLATGPLGLIIAGTGLLGVELGKLTGVGDHATDNVDALTSAMFDAARGSQQAQTALNGFAGMAQFAADSPAHATESLKNLDSALVKLYQTNPQEAGREFDALSKSLEGSGTSASQVAKDFPQYSKALADAQLQSHLLGSGVDKLTSSLLDQQQKTALAAQASAQSTLAALGATEGQNKLTQQLYGSLTAYSAAATGAGAYTSALNSLNGVTATLDDAQNSLAQQLLNAKTSFAQNKYSMDLNTQAGIDNRDALSQAAKSIAALGTAQYQATGSIDTANRTIEQQINQFVKNTGATGKNKDAIYAYLESLSKIPPNVATNVVLDTGKAEQGLQVLLNRINTSSGTVTVYENAIGAVGSTSLPRGMRAQAHGGVVGAAASGGPRSNLTLVGEQGIELVDLPPGTSVHSNPDTQRILGDIAPRGAGVMTVKFDGDLDSAFAASFMMLIRQGKITIKQSAVVV